MSKRYHPATIIVRKTQRGLFPVSSYDAELLMADPFMTEYDLVRRSKRSLPQQRLYWKVLGSVVKGTGRWPTSLHLHDELRFACGFRRPLVDWESGRVVDVLDSTALDAMSQDAFQAYFDLAMLKLSEHLGYDVLAFTEAA